MDVRFYINEFPNINETVAVEVTSIAELGVYVKLLEYNNLEGLIISSELSRQRIKNIKNITRIKKIEYANVIHVDKNKGYIDLSKKSVTPDELSQSQIRYFESKIANDILKCISIDTNQSLQYIYDIIGYPLVDKYGSILQGLKQSIFNQQITNIIKTKIQPKQIKLRSDIELTCFSYHGIDGIKNAILSCNTKGPKFHFLKSPSYILLHKDYNQYEGINLMNNILLELKTNIEKYGGNLNIIESPRVISAEQNDIMNKIILADIGADIGADYEVK